MSYNGIEDLELGSTQLYFPSITDEIRELVVSAARGAAEDALKRQEEKYRAELGRQKREFVEFTQEQEKRIYASTSQFMDRVLNLLFPHSDNLYVTSAEYEKLTQQTYAQVIRIRNQRDQLRLIEEKLSLMKTWRGIFRTIGQKLGICR